MTEIKFFAVMILIILLEVYVLANTKYFWLGGIIPLLGTIGIIWVMINTQPLVAHDFLIATIGIFTLLIFWGLGHDRYTKRTLKEKEKIKI